MVSSSCKDGFASLEINHDPYYLNFPMPFDLFKPNTIENHWRDQIQDIGDYASRRCLYHSYVNTIKAIVALQWYQSEHGKLPDALTELVPQYINSAPVDAFDGESLRYSEKNKWVYSVGADYNDDGGSKDTFFRGGCSGAFGKHDKAEVDACRMNPTVPINWNDYPTSMR